MNLPAAIYAHAQALPPDLQREAMDFIAYLEQRYGLTPAASRPTTEAFITHFAGMIGADFPDDVDDTDQGPDAPRESLE